MVDNEFRRLTTLREYLINQSSIQGCRMVRNFALAFAEFFEARIGSNTSTPVYAELPVRIIWAKLFSVDIVLLVFNSGLKVHPPMTQP
ncbi:uncharacterized protein CLUP02_11210 [Colletotrichum lupini]|uniref:Uncharacterized protein n=1 Tax=Colletotrichum lupini TaxID=145971 RepID=A0A9Q8SY62_9PEZI|nr:uncharacterized protein CLUP02_11210 [Colletotrichum lupini]UQC85711.1 hypothetical protein CLUP02_11210 [Colletotrichum lupini]